MDTPRLYTPPVDAELLPFHIDREVTSPALQEVPTLSQGLRDLVADALDISVEELAASILSDAVSTSPAPSGAASVREEEELPELLFSVA